MIKPSIIWKMEGKEKATEAKLADIRDLAQGMKAAGHDPRLLSGLLSEKEMLGLLGKAHALLSQLPNVWRMYVPAHVRVTVVGDTHGQFYDVAALFDRHGYPSEDHYYVFNGDYIDRGWWGTENMILLLSLKCAFPHWFHMSRGNHESASCATAYGFKDECVEKYSLAVFTSFLQVFAALPLACVISRKKDDPVYHSMAGEKKKKRSKKKQKKHHKPHNTHNVKFDAPGIMVMHGGLFRQPNGMIGSLSSLARIRRGEEDPDSQTLVDILWSDPHVKDGMDDNYLRGCGIVFGASITADFLKDNNLTGIIRSHEGPDAREKRSFMEGNMMNGYSIDHVGQTSEEPLLTTLFSAPDYPQGPLSRQNIACVLDLTLDNEGVFQREFVPFAAVKHPFSL